MAAHSMTRAAPLLPRRLAGIFYSVDRPYFIFGRALRPFDRADRGASLMGDAFCQILLLLLRRRARRFFGLPAVRRLRR